MGKRERESDEGVEDSFPPSNLRANDESIKCPYWPCSHGSKQFDDYASYEMHILNNHNYICLECHKTFPSDPILSLHIDENHNPMLQIQKENGSKIYKCFLYLQGCKKVCSTPHKRKLHMIDKHQYPKDYDFRIVRQGTRQIDI